MLFPCKGLTKCDPIKFLSKKHVRQAMEWVSIGKAFQINLWKNVSRTKYFSMKTKFKQHLALPCDPSKTLLNVERFLVGLWYIKIHNFFYLYIYLYNLKHLESEFKWQKKTKTKIKKLDKKYFGIIVFINTLSTNPRKWSNTLKQFANCSQRIDWVCLTTLWVGA